MQVRSEAGSVILIRCLIHAASTAGFSFCNFVFASILAALA